MRPSWIRAWLGASLALTITLGACAPNSSTGARDPSDPAADALPDRDPALAHELVEDHGALLLDVRSASEFESGHADGAVLVPHGEVPTRVDEIVELQGGDKTKPIVVYCRSGYRAGIAKQSLLDAGFTHVTNVGGLTDYQSAD